MVASRPSSSPSRAPARRCSRPRSPSAPAECGQRSSPRSLTKLKNPPHRARTRRRQLRPDRTCRARRTLRRARFTGHTLVNEAIMSRRPGGSGARALRPVCGSDAARSASACCSGVRTRAQQRGVSSSVKALDPQHLLLEGLNRLLGAAVCLGLVVERRGAGNPEVVDLGLVVLGAEARPAVVAQCQPSGDRGVQRSLIS